MRLSFVSKNLDRELTSSGYLLLRSRVQRAMIEEKCANKFHSEAEELCHDNG